jgi:hypothetical protein
MYRKNLKKIVIEYLGLKDIVKRRDRMLNLSQMYRRVTFQRKNTPLAAVYPKKNLRQLFSKNNNMKISLLLSKFIILLVF